MYDFTTDKIKNYKTNKNKLMGLEIKMNEKESTNAILLGANRPELKQEPALFG